MKLIRMLIVIGGWAVLAHSAAAGDMVVLSSTIKEVEPGGVFSSSTSFSVLSGAKVTFILSSGKVVTINGPFEGPLPANTDTARDDRVIPTISKILSAPKLEKGRVGATRSGPSLADPWIIDLRRPGRYCYSAQVELKFWRALDEQPETVFVRPETGSLETSVAWPSGAKLLAWPRNFPLESGKTYQVRLEPNNRQIPVELLQVPDLPTDVHRAAWMGENGCETQARKLLALMHD